MRREHGDARARSTLSTNVSSSLQSRSYAQRAPSAVAGLRACISSESPACETSCSTVAGAGIPLGHEAIYTVCGTTFKVDQIYKDLKAVGKGSYGVVCSATNSVTGENVAIKRVAPMSTHVIDAKHVLREIRIMRQLGKHDNVITLKDLFIREADDELYIVMELLDSDLHRIIQSKQTLSEAHHRFFMHQVLKGLKYLHDHRIIHRDLKPGNLLVTRSCELRITDFGLARARPMGKGADPDEEVEDAMTEHVVTRWYRPPELMLCPDGMYDYAVDMWSVGCIFAELLGRKPLFPGKNFVEQLTLIFDVIGAPRGSEVSHVKSGQARKFLESISHKRPVAMASKFPDHSPEAVNLVESLLIFNPVRRLTVDQALAHSYLDPLRSAIPDNPPPLTTIPSFEFENHEVTKEELQRTIMLEVDSFRYENTMQGRYGPVAGGYMQPAAHPGQPPIAPSDTRPSSSDATAPAAAAVPEAHQDASPVMSKATSQLKQQTPLPPPPPPAGAFTGYARSAALPQDSSTGPPPQCAQTTGRSFPFSGRGLFGGHEKTKGILGAVINVTKAITSPTGVTSSSSWAGLGRNQTGHPQQHLLHQQMVAEQIQAGYPQEPSDLDSDVGPASATSSMAATQAARHDLIPGVPESTSGFFSAQLSASAHAGMSSSSDPTSSLTSSGLVSQTDRTPPFQRCWPAGNSAVSQHPTIAGRLQSSYPHLNSEDGVKSVLNQAQPVVGEGKDNWESRGHARRQERGAENMPYNWVAGEQGGWKMVDMEEGEARAEELTAPMSVDEENLEAREGHGAAYDFVRGRRGFLPGHTNNPYAQPAHYHPLYFHQQPGEEPEKSSWQRQERDVGRDREGREDIMAVESRGQQPLENSGESGIGWREGRRVTVPRSPVFSVMSWQRKGNGDRGRGNRGRDGGRAKWR